MFLNNSNSNFEAPYHIQYCVILHFYCRLFHHTMNQCSNELVIIRPKHISFISVYSSTASVSAISSTIKRETETNSHNGDARRTRKGAKTDILYIVTAL